MFSFVDESFGVSLDVRYLPGAHELCVTEKGD